MRRPVIYLYLTLFLAIGHSVVLHAQNPVNWTEKQLMEPSELVNELKNKNEIPVIISVGPGAPIPHSIGIGMVNDAGNFQKLNEYLQGISRDKKLVLYCGCCPFEHCPNVRPAIDALKKLNFTNYYLLNLPKNIKTDWIDKGYPVAAQ